MISSWIPRDTYASQLIEIISVVSENAIDDLAGILRLCGVSERMKRIVAGWAHVYKRVRGVRVT